MVYGDRTTKYSDVCMEALTSPTQSRVWMNRMLKDNLCVRRVINNFTASKNPIAVLLGEEKPRCEKRAGSLLSHSVEEILMARVCSLEEFVKNTKQQTRESNRHRGLDVQMLCDEE